jgi:hypothetical protein
MMKHWGQEKRGDGKNVLLLDFWLTIGRGEGNPRRPSVRATANYPSLARNERAINLKMELPIALFEAPSLSASITVDSPAQAVTINAETVAEAVRQVIGMDIDIQISRGDEN